LTPSRPGNALTAATVGTILSATSGTDKIILSVSTADTFEDLTFKDADLYDGLSGLVVRYGTGSFVLDGYSTADVASGVIGAEDFVFL